MELTGSDHYELEQNKDRAHDFTVVELAGRTEFVAKQELEHKEQADDQQAPDGSQQGVLEVSVEILADEDDDAEVGVEPVGDKQRGENKEPVVLIFEEDFFVLEIEKNREQSEGEKEQPGLKYSNSEPPEQLFLTKQHWTDTSSIFTFSSLHIHI